MCLAVPVKILEVKNSDVAKVEHAGVRFEVTTTLVNNLSVGDYVLVHAGFVIEKLSLEDAKETLKLWDEFNEKVGANGNRA